MILSALIAASLSAFITVADEVNVSDGVVRLGDVVRFDGDRQAKLETLAIARLPNGVTHIQLSRADLRMLASRAVPGLQFGATAGGNVIIRRSAIATVNIAACYEAARSIAAGEILSIEDVASVSCEPEKKNAAVRYDRQSASAIAIHPIDAGDYLGSGHFQFRPSVRRGEKLTLNSRSGPVVIERPVVAMQDARPTDRRVFVQTDDGAVFATDIAPERAQ